jgi:hypothetical protein
LYQICTAFGSERRRRGAGTGRGRACMRCVLHAVPPLSFASPAAASLPPSARTRPFAAGLGPGGGARGRAPAAVLARAPKLNPPRPLDTRASAQGAWRARMPSGCEGGEASKTQPLSSIPLVVSGCTIARALDGPPPFLKSTTCRPAPLITPRTPKNAPFLSPRKSPCSRRVPAALPARAGRSLWAAFGVCVVFRAAR